MAVPAAACIDHPTLLMLLADGRLHSGEWLARELNVSRTAVWKGVARLRLRGIEIESRRRRGYSMPGGIELLARPAIRAVLAEQQLRRLRSLDLCFEVDSTNTRLLDAAAPPAGHANVLLAELQHAGRGRRGRQWMVPFGASIAMSLAWVFADAGRASSTLSLCVGVAVVRALERAGASGIGLKWPNDIWFDDKKIGGILIELRGEAHGPAHVVIGIGINVSLTAAMRARIEATGVRVAAVADACSASPSRNLIAGAIIDELLSMLPQFEREGFSAFRHAWTGLDVLRDRPAQVSVGDGVVRGTARGVDCHGALQVERDGRLFEFVSGEASLRMGCE